MPTVLVVEQATMLGALYELELSEEGYTVILAQTVVQALKIVESRPVDLIVADISGCDQEADAAEKSLIYGVNVPVIINTGYHVRMISGHLSTRIAHILKSSNLAVLKQKIKIMLAWRAHNGVEKTVPLAPLKSGRKILLAKGNNIFLAGETGRLECGHGSAAH
jgi:DNA-binding response OmpR family regulator